MIDYYVALVNAHLIARSYLRSFSYCSSLVITLRDETSTIDIIEEEDDVINCNCSCLRAKVVFEEDANRTDDCTKRTRVIETR